MQSQTRVFITLSVVVLLVSGLYLFSDWFSKATGYVLGEDQKVAFARCLTSQNTAFYETSNCAACEQQRTILGEEAWSIISTQNCDAETKCGGLRSLPAWEIEGKFYYGVKTFEELDELSSCDIAPRS